MIHFVIHTVISVVYLVAALTLEDKFAKASCLILSGVWAATL